MMSVSVVMTVLNEEATIRPALDALVGQTRRPDEVVIADGGSSDRTAAIVRGYADRLPLCLLEVPGANISQGRNAAIRQASGEVIAVTDAGAWAEPDWLEKLVAPFEADRRQSPIAYRLSLGALQSRSHSMSDQPYAIGQEVCAVAGFFKADPRSPFEVALGATTLPLPEDIRPATYLASSRNVAFRRSAWEAAGGYPEWLDYCEDVVFDLKMRALYGPFHFAPEALVHFRPRTSLRAFFRQYFLYARGDGKASLFGKIHALRYFAYLVVGPLVAFAALTVSPWLWLLAALAAASYLRTPVRRLVKQWGQSGLSDRVKLLAWVPVIRVIGDLAKMLGYPSGLAWRFRHREKQ